MNLTWLYSSALVDHTLRIWPPPPVSSAEDMPMQHKGDCQVHPLLPFEVLYHRNLGNLLQGTVFGCDC